MKRISLVLGTLVVLSIMASFAQSFAQTASQADFNALVAKRITLSAEFDKKYAETPHLADQFRDVTALQKSYDAAYAKHNEWAKNPPSLSERDAHDAAIAKLIPLIAAHTVHVANLSARVEDFTKRKAAHDTNRCYYPPNNPSACDYYERDRQALQTEAAELQQQIADANQTAATYNGQKAELDAQKARFADENARIDADAKAVDAQGAILNAAVADYRAKVAPLKQPWRDNEAAIAAIVVGKKAAGVKVDDCQTALNDTLPSAQENIKTVCGLMFK